MVRDWVRVFIGMGANDGEPLAQIEHAFAALKDLPGTTGLKRSRVFRSAPWQAHGPDFINAMAQIDTQLSAPALWAHLQRMEQAAGRIRPYRNAPRTLDLDLIFYGEAHMHSPELTVPHPRWRERAFVLAPLSDLAPERIHFRDWEAVAGQAIAPLAG